MRVEGVHWWVEAWGIGILWSGLGLIAGRVLGTWLGLIVERYVAATAAWRLAGWSTWWHLRRHTAPTESIVEIRIWIVHNTGYLVSHGIFLAFSVKIHIQSLHHFVRGLVLNISLLGKLPHSVNHFSGLGIFEIDIFCHHWVNLILVGIGLFHEFFSEERLQLLSHSHELLNIQLRSNVDERSECLVHVWGLAHFRNIIESSLQLIAHGGGNIIAWNHGLIIDQSLAPDFGIDLIL